jgi:WD40 repeat protein
MTNKYLTPLCGVLLVCLTSCVSLNPNQADFTLEHRNKVRFLSPFPPENRAAVFSDDGTITVWDIRDGQMVREIDPDRNEEAMFMAYSRYGIVVRYWRSNVLAFFPVNEGLVQSTTLGKSFGDNVVRNIVCSPDGKYVVYDVIDDESTSDTDWDSNWNPHSGTTKTKETTVSRSRYSGKLHCVDAENNKCLFEIPLPSSSSTTISTTTKYDYKDLGSDSATNTTSYGNIIFLTSIAVDPQFETIACGFSDGTIHIYDTKKRGRPEKIDAHEQAVTALTFSPKGAYLLSGDRSGFIYQWKETEDLSGKREWNRSGQLKIDNQVMSINVSPNGKTFIVKDSAKVFRIISFINGMEIKAIKGGNLINSVLYKPDNQIAALGIKDNAVFVWGLGAF